MTRIRAAVLFILCGAISVPAVAQTAIGGGIKAGVNFASVSGDFDDASKNMRIGAAVGGFISFRLGERITFEPEVLYSQEGVEVEFSDGGQTFKSAVKLDMVQIPLLLRFATNSGGRATGYVIVGPSIGIVASAKQHDPFEGDDEDIKDDVESASYSIVFGAGVNISRFLIEGRYSLGLNDLNKDEEEDGNNKSRVFSLLFGVRF